MGRWLVRGQGWRGGSRRGGDEGEDGVLTGHVLVWLWGVFSAIWVDGGAMWSVEARRGLAKRMLLSCSLFPCEINF